MIRKITARTRKIMISHLPIVHAVLPVKPRISNTTAITINSIPGHNSQSDMIYHKPDVLFMTGSIIFYRELNFLGMPKQFIQ